MTNDFPNISLRRIHDQQIRAWFGEVRPLRLEGSGKFFTPPPALPLRAVFVPPAMSATYFQPTASEKHLSGGADVLHWFGQHQRLVVLGDPGSGKSTLVSWLAWRLCAGLTERLPEWAEGVVPIPMILRDMQLDNVTCFDDLLTAYLHTDVIAGHSELRQVWGSYLQELVATQSASLLFLIDGLDELSAGTREKVRDALRDGMHRFSQARFMVTSRIVGYEQCAVETPKAEARDLSDAESADFAKVEATQQLTVDVHRLYVMPFDNGRIRQFARNWFEHGETQDRRGEAYREQFIAGVMRDQVTLQLARTPNLLVMAAQVYGITSTLPDGRAKLYEAITKAYLESIDQRYGLLDQRYTLEQKKAWLAAVGYHMQSRRSESNADGMTRDLLVAESEVIECLSEAMRESGLEPDKAYVGNFVDAIARRSGLFIPRGEGIYAFAHLSIQEYFAALHLQNSVRDYAVSDPKRLQALFEELAGLGAAPAWREALVTFFELPDWSPRVIATLFQAVFGEDLARVPKVARRAGDSERIVNAELIETLARLVVNPGIALPATMREQGFARSLDYLRTERRSNSGKPISGVLGALTVNEEGSRRLWQLLRAQSDSLSGSGKVLDLRGARFVDFSPLSSFPEVTGLLLDDTLIADLSPLANLELLLELRLERTPVQSLAPVSRLKQLQRLRLSQTQVSDLSPLSELTALRSLRLDNTPVSDITPLSNLASLYELSLNQTGVKDLTPLAGTVALRTLFLESTLVSDLTPLSGLPVLGLLSISHTAVLDLSPLRRVSSMSFLNVSRTGVHDLTPLKGLKELMYLYLNSTPVRDLQPLAKLAKLRTLMFSDTQVSDVTPLSGLTSLKDLYMTRSQVKDISPLAQIKKLRIVGKP